MFDDTIVEMREETIYRASAHNALQREPQSIQWFSFSFFMGNIQSIQ